MSIGDKIKKYREVYDLSQAELAGQAGMERTILARIEKGKRRVTYETAVRLAEVMRLPVEELYEVSAGVARR